MSKAAIIRPKLDKRVSLHKLEILCLVVELGTVTRAAEHLYVAQPVVSAHLRSLEERFGVTLFVRDGRRLRLTEAGEHVYQMASDTMARARAMLRELEGLDDGAQGAAVIGASMSIGSYLLPAVLTEFRQTRPGVEITMAVGDPESMLRGVEQGDYDFGVVIRDGPPDAGILQGEWLGTDDIVLVTAPDGHPEGDEIPLDALNDIPLVGSPRGSARSLLEDHALARFNLTLGKPILELGHPEALKRAVIAGVGATLLTRSAVEDELARGELREVRFSDAQLDVPIYYVQRRDKRLSEMQRLLFEAIRSSLSTRGRRSLEVVGADDQ